MEHVHCSDCEAPEVSERRGVELVSYHCLQGRPGFKLALLHHGSRWLLYMGHIWHAGWSVLDVTDASSPRFVGFLEGPSDTWTLQVQVADGLMLTALEKPPPGWGADPGATSEEGCLIWELSDPEKPTLAGTYRTGGSGTHRNFYAGGDYAYMAANIEGTEGRLLTIVDVSNPTSPREVARSGWPNQNEAGHFASYMHGPAHVEGNRAYVSYGKVGALILDVSNPVRTIADLAPITGTSRQQDRMSHRPPLPRSRVICWSAARRSTRVATVNGTIPSSSTSRMRGHQE